MCTLILLYKVLKEYPIVLAENRDAHIKSIEIPPAIVFKIPKIYAALDKKSQGTWFGLNENEVAVGLTNLYSSTEERKPSDSRGRLCLNALKKPSAKEVSEYLQEAYDFEKYGKANIVSADKNDAILTMCDREVNAFKLDPGIHVLTNYNLKHEPSTLEDIDTMVDSKHRRDRAVELIDNYQMDRMKDIDAVGDILKIMLSDHVKSDHPRASKHKQYFTICCHGDEIEYPWKTTSSSIVALSKDGIGKSKYWYCAGNPCEPNNGFTDYSFILNDDVMSVP